MTKGTVVVDSCHLVVVDSSLSHLHLHFLLAFSVNRHFTFSLYSAVSITTMVFQLSGWKTVMFLSSFRVLRAVCSSLSMLVWGYDLFSFITLQKLPQRMLYVIHHCLLVAHPTSRTFNQNYNVYACMISSVGQEQSFWQRSYSSVSVSV